MEKPNDKTFHVWAGMALSILCALTLFYVTNMHLGYVYLIALASGIIAGAAKEWIWDKALKMGQFSLLDFYCTIWGSFCGTLIGIAITQYISQ